MSALAEGMVGVYSSGRIFHKNLFIRLSLSIKDMDMLEEKFDDQSNWIELKLYADSASEAKQGPLTCWLMTLSTYQKAMAASGYSGKGLKPVNTFKPTVEKVKEFFRK